MNSTEPEYDDTIHRSAVSELLISNLVSSRTDREEAEKANNWILLKSKANQKGDLLAEYMRRCSEFKDWEKKECNGKEAVEIYFNKSVNYVAGCGFKRRSAEKIARDIILSVRLNGIDLSDTEEFKENYLTISYQTICKYMERNINLK